MVLLELQAPTVTSSAQNFSDFFVDSGSESRALSRKHKKRGGNFSTQNSLLKFVFNPVLTSCLNNCSEKKPVQWNLWRLRAYEKNLSVRLFFEDRLPALTPLEFDSRTCDLRRARDDVTFSNQEIPFPHAWEKKQFFKTKFIKKKA